MRTLGLLLTMFALAATPAAAAPWSSPAPIPGAPDAVPVLAESAGGPQAVYWGTFDPTKLQSPITAFVSVLGTGPTPQPAAKLSPSLNVSQAALYGNRHVALATFGNATVKVPGSLVGVATGPLKGPMKTHALPAEVRSLAGNAAGDLAVMIEHCATNVGGCHPSAPAVVLDRPGRGFGDPITLDRKGHSFGGSLAIDAHGRVLAAWDRAGVVYARFVSIKGKLSPIQRLGTDTGGGFNVVLSNDGRAAVGWTTQTFSTATAPAVFAAKLAVAGASGHFGATRTLETGQLTGTQSSIPYQGVVIKLPAGEPGLAAWTGYDGAHFTVRAAPIDGTTVGAPQTVSTPGTDTILADAAEGSRGQAVILLLPGQAGADPTGTIAPAGMVAVTHPAGTQTFGLPEEVVPGPAYVASAAVSIDAATGSVFATWRDVGSPAGWAVRAPLG